MFLLRALVHWFPFLQACAHARITEQDAGYLSPGERRTNVAADTEQWEQVNSPSGREQLQQLVYWYVLAACHRRVVIFQV